VDDLLGVLDLRTDRGSAGPGTEQKHYPPCGKAMHGRRASRRRQSTLPMERTEAARRPAG
jgi:hypothetical protein